MLPWFGTISSIIGSFLVAFGIYFLGYCAFLAGAAAWLFVAYKQQDKALGLLNGIFLITNIIGLIRA